MVVILKKMTLNVRRFYKGVNDRRKVALGKFEKQNSSQRRSSLVRRWWNVPKKLGTRNARNKSKLLKKEFDERI